MPTRITVVGSANLDLVAAAPKLPAPGETVTGARLERHPGGKGANQALAARRLGAEVRLFAQVGADAAADEALALLRAEGVDLHGVRVHPTEPTAIALIVVAPDGENQIAVASGANAAPWAGPLELGAADAVICQLEIPSETAPAAAAQARFFCLNAAPAKPLPAALLQACDLLVVNEHEAAALGEGLEAAGKLAAITYGAAGAVLRQGGQELARATPPRVQAIDTTGAGDAFTGALVLALCEGQPPEQALRFACAAGAAACTVRGAQSALPSRDLVERLLAEG